MGALRQEFGARLRHKFGARLRHDVGARLRHDVGIRNAEHDAVTAPPFEAHTFGLDGWFEA